MELKPGYKQTEIGVIPEDWDVKTVGEVADVKGGKRLPLGKSLSDSSTPHPYIRVVDMFMGGVSLNDLKYVPVDVFPSIKNYRIFKGDLFVTVAGTLGIVGKVPPELDGANLTENADKITDIKCNQDFLLYVLTSPLVQNAIESERTLGAQPKLALTRIKTFQILLPRNEEEQQAIATALSDVDALITALDRLIAKKRDIKQAAMQELLTGKRRLPGFSEEWQLLPLENLCARNRLIRGPFGGSLKKDSFVADGYKVYEQKNAIQRDSELGSYFINEGKFNELKRFEVQSGDFIVSCSGTIGRIFRIPEAARPGIINQALLKITIDETVVNSRYFFYYFDWDKFQERITDNTQGGAMQNLIGMGVFRKVPVHLPSLPEQHAIAEILSDMDAEIAALERKREKTRLLKQGVMQELLTGRIRLV